MTAPGFTTDIEVLEATRQRAIGIVANLRTTATTMTNELEARAGEWVGQGGSAFQVTHTGIRVDMDNMNNALDRLQEMLGQAATNYVATEGDVATGIQQAGAEAGSISSGLRA